MDADEELYKATPQVQGTIAHESVDNKTYSTKKNDILALSVYSNELGVMGKIDLFKVDEKILIERKYQLKRIFQGQIYQLWAQYFCLLEMGYDVQKIAFYEISTNKMIPLETPTETSKEELKQFIARFKAFNPTDHIITNPCKCQHCIYCNLCDKTDTENVYS